MLCGTNNFMWTIPSFKLIDGAFRIRVSLPHNIVLDLNNVMFLYSFV